MRSLRRRNWFIKRIALGFAVAAFVAPVAQARVDEGSIRPAKVESSIVQAHTYQPVFSAASDVRADIPGETVSNIANDVRADRPGETVSNIGNVGESFGRFARPNSTTGQELDAISWNDAAVGGVGVVFALALVLLFGAATLAARPAGREQTA